MQKTQRKKQVVVIHGGDIFKTYDEYLDFLRNYEIDIERYKSNKTDWKPWLREALGEEYEVILPVMPNKTNAHSLGGIFLAKYLSENKFPVKINGVFLVGAVYDKDCEGYPAVSFSLPEKLDLQTRQIYLYHSKDDPVVPFSALEQYKKALPNAQTRIFEDRKHLNQEQFPELVEDILKLGTL